MGSDRGPGLGKPRVHTARISILIEKEYKDMIKRCAEHSGLDMSTVIRCATLWALGFDECSFIVAMLRSVCEEGKPVENRHLRGVLL